MSEIIIILLKRKDDFTEPAHYLKTKPMTSLHQHTLYCNLAANQIHSIMRDRNNLMTNQIHLIMTTKLASFLTRNSPNYTAIIPTDITVDSQLEDILYLIY